MARYDLRNPDSLPGPLYVDTTCIDCGTCFHLASDLFVENFDLSNVVKQPVSLEEWGRAKAAILSCPTNSIGVQAPPSIFNSAVANLPMAINPHTYFLGFTSRDSFGATSYLIVREGGNVMVDSPRFNQRLVRGIEKLGGVKYMFLTHRDDVADHQAFRNHFQCQRIIHQDDQTEGTMNCEIIIKNESARLIDEDLLAIPTPGHSKGHMVLLHQKMLFSGDHLFYAPDSKELYASKNVCWYSWTKQIDSIRKLLFYDFEWVLPGHGGWMKASVSSNKENLARIVRG
jgi:glyoxylase-like metal-dependent hydrolase (beta-lactamase superfamily II)/ferredoxin